MWSSFPRHMYASAHPSRQVLMFDDQSCSISASCTMDSAQKAYDCFGKLLCVRHKA